jgi:hypothetical protein
LLQVGEKLSACQLELLEENEIGPAVKDIHTNDALALFKCKGSYS